MFGKKTRPVTEAPSGGRTAAAVPAAAPRSLPKALQTASKGKQAYEARRAEKAGIGLEKWMADKDRRAQAERDLVQRQRRAAAPAKKPGLLRRLLDRAHKPL